jgi:fatty-acyl-CoA synthase
VDVPQPESTSATRSPLHNVGGWVARWARIRPRYPAVWDAERRLTWADLEDRTARLAGWLTAQGVGTGDRVALCLSNRSAYLEAVFAVARIGAISLPVNTRLSPREIAYLFDDCAPSLVLHELDLHRVIDAARKAAQAAPRLLCVGGPDCAYEAALAKTPPTSEIVAVAPDDPMMLMYTSGTTGVPKGALLPHRKTFANSLNAQLFFGIRHDDRVLVVAPLFHSLGLLILSVPAVYCGAHLVLQPRFDPADVWSCVERERITYLGGVPTMYQRLHDAIDDAAAPGPPRDLSSLRFLFTAGAAVPAELVRAFGARGLVLKQGYGQTETSILCCLDAQDAVRKAGSVGRPVFHGEVRVVGVAQLGDPPEAWRDVAPGEAGEIVVRGPITMLGYWGRPDETADTLRGEWLRTGDLATVDDEGFVTLVGRARDMLISGGENVYPAEIEAVYSDHPCVREIAVVGVPDARWGEVGRAHVVMNRGQALDSEGLKAWGRERLASFKVPQEFVEEAELPRTASGKVQKHLLLDPAS